MNTQHDRSDLLDAFDELVFGLDADGTLHEWNAYFADLVGVDDLVATPFVELFDDSEAVRDAVDRALTDGVRTTAVSTLVGEGTEVYELHISPAAGESLALVGNGRRRDLGSRDVEAILDRMASAFLALDDEWRFTYLNERGGEVISAVADDEYTVDDLRGRDIWEVLPEAVGSPFYEKYHEAMETQEPVSFEAQYEPAGMWFEVRAYPSESGLSVYFTDATRERRQREELQERERVLRTIHDVISDPDRTFEEQVDALMSVGRAVLGTSYATLSYVDGDEYRFELVEAPNDELEAGDVVPLSETNCERAVLARETLVLDNVPEDAPDLAGRTGNSQLGIACYLGAPVVVDDEVYGTFCFFDDEAREDDFSEWDAAVVDIMSRWIGYELERERVTDALRRQNERLDQFAAIVSHDLRNPLNVARGRLELAAEVVEDEDAAENLAAAETAHDRMEALIGDLLTMSREGTAVEGTERVTLSTVAESAWRTVATGDATVRVVDDRELDADPDRLRQLFENLFRNSVEHGSTGSRASPDDSVEHGPDGVVVTVGGLPDGFFVEDDGPGIDDDDRETVFEAGYSTDEGGTGFGLAIVRELASAHGWTVDAVAPELGDGARFEVRGSPDS